MKKILSTLTAIEAYLREINGHLIFLCHLAETRAQEEKEMQKNEESYSIELFRDLL